MNKEKIKGYVLITGKMYEPRLIVNPGFWEGTAVATVGIAFEYAVKDALNKTLVTGAVSSERTAEGGSGANCDKSVIPITNATQKATREILERYIERIANDPKLHE